jgi:hypothetical protein
MFELYKTSLGYILQQIKLFERKRVYFRDNLVSCKYNFHCTIVLLALCNLILVSVGSLACFMLGRVTIRLWCEIDRLPLMMMMMMMI